jgi:formylglycine-generating enzyme required for sulfatase activity
VALGVLAQLYACADPGVHVTAVAGQGLSDQSVSSIRTLDLSVRGDERLDLPIKLHRPFSPSREERFIYLPQPASRTLQFSITALAADAIVVAFGKVGVTARPGQAVDARLLLDSITGPPPDGGQTEQNGTDMALGSGVDMALPYVPPSCAGNMNQNCGPSTNSNCCASPVVPGGMYNRGNDSNYPATVSTFLLDQYEVTVGRFRQFLTAGYGTQAKPPAAGSGANPNLPGSGWDSSWSASLAASTSALSTNVKCDSTRQTWTDTPGANENRAQNCLDWFTAFAFCIWDGGRLPTEAEWNYAAAGGSEQRNYPWSNPPSSMTIDDSYAVYSGMATAVAPVGSKSPKGDGKWGHADLAGNVWEWNLDWYDLYPNPCDDCADLGGNLGRVLRSGSFGDSALLMLSSERNWDGPSIRDSSRGSRCVRNP